jgi:uncharacterized protein (UPF0332 family)
MTGSEFITCAESLASGVLEADRRSAVSRAYYGAFHEARARLRACGVRLPKTEQVHVKMGYCLCDCGDPIAERAGRHLETLRAQRTVADYDLDDGRFMASGAARSEIVRARQIVEALAKLGRAEAAEFRAKIRAHAKLLGLVVSD